ncbi:hypothetical protein [Psychrilyobacter atlanticus]|uniref:hypothetical protein n=1 Tax=Psychrilyobacter atlanticus TaxID=271091 RepID=UPI000408ABFB|nr:hypothetical protein [Psychrilyobacter atlanticus]
MYRGFKITKETIEKILEDKEYYRRGYKRDAEEIKKKIKNKLEKYLTSNSKIDVEKLREEWFPTGEYDIFLSHSHGDIEDIEALAGYLVNEKGLKVFVDSFIWGYYHELLEDLNRTYNWNKNTQTYDHSGAKWCCSNVTMILNSALQEVIDKSEVLFFYNTLNSITHDYNSKNRTESPWIFSEIETSRIIRKNMPRRVEAMCEAVREEFSDDYEKKVAEFSYWLNNNHLIKIDQDQFNEWTGNVENNDYLKFCDMVNIPHGGLENLIKAGEELDKLYEIVGEEK